MVRQHLAFAKYLHTLKLLRWYGEHLHGGDYNVDSFIAVFKEIADMKSKMADQWAKANDRYPTSEALRRLATKKPQAGKGKEKSGKSNAKEKEIQEQDHQKDQVQDQLNHQQ